MSRIKLSLINTDKDYQILDIFLDSDGLISPEQLNEIELPEDIDYTKGIVINGKAPIWLYAHLVHLCHISAFVAVFDPRLGAVIVQRHLPGDPALGGIIPLQDLLQYFKNKETQKKSKKVVNNDIKVIAFLGPPHSGKTVLMNHLRLALRNRKPKFYQNDFFILRACPDGEGDWFAEADNNISKTIRFKNAFNDEFVDKVCSQLSGLKKTKKILFVDCGGKIDKYNQQILNLCTHTIIISSDPKQIPEWIGAAKASNQNIISEIVSKTYQCSEIISTNPLKINLGILDRNVYEIKIPLELLNSLDI